jgi:hypothetical protein
MRVRTDPALVAFCGGETRVRTLGTLANAQFPMTGYRVAKVAGVPEPKVYPELRRAVRAGIVRKEKDGYRLIDADVRALLQKRVRLFWDVDWDRARDGWDGETSRLLQQGLSAIRQRLRSDSSFLRPRGWKPPLAARSWDRELRRPPGKDARIRRRGYRSSKREDWVQ